MYYSFEAERVINTFNSSGKSGLNGKTVQKNKERFGINVLTEKKRDGIFKRLLSALKEPMILILIFGLILTLGVNFGKTLKTGDGDFTECIGILFAIILSVSITLIMEGSSIKAFTALNKIYDNAQVSVIRNGETVLISQRELVVGDIVLLEAGDKVFADGRLFTSSNLSMDESALTGESNATKKEAGVKLPLSTPLAERKNCVYSGTFVSSGSGKMIVTAVGDQTEIGKIAGEISGENKENSPLQTKLNKLGKTITTVGIITASFVFLLSVIRLLLAGTLNFSSVQELFISAIVLIVAAVPEGLPTIVAVSLALNMIKLSKENALIKKMTATETCGAVSIICSDKTGTLTQNKMSVDSVCMSQVCVGNGEEISDNLMQNFALNSTAIESGKKITGSGTESALIEYFIKYGKENLNTFRERYKIIDRVPFDSEIKYMTTTVEMDGEKKEFIKGAPEKVLRKCNLTEKQCEKILSEMEKKEREAKRIICFAHRVGEGDYLYDGFVSLSDPVRKEVYKAVKDCNRAGIKVKMLTGDNKVTAYAIAKELKIATDESMVVNASDLENLDDKSLVKALSKITVIARSTPIIKLRVVKALKSSGEVVAVTGDGINDAPAIRHADIGIAMATGSEITKEAADCILLDDSFGTVIRAVSFGRNVYKNLQRFILFQLSVNLSALIFVTVVCLLGLPAPFNTLQLLWINVIMDGPPALTLGLEPPSDKLMSLKPVKKDVGIVSFKMLLRILFNGIFMAAVIILQYVYNFLGVSEIERGGAIFTLFILFQLFNAFNSRELGTESIFKVLSKNKIMVATFISVFIVHFIIVTFIPNLFGVHPLKFITWIKCLITSFSIVGVSEIFKVIYRAVIAGKDVKEKTVINSFYHK